MDLPGGEDGGTPRAAIVAMGESIATLVIGPSPNRSAYSQRFNGAGDTAHHLPAAGFFPGFRLRIFLTA